MEIFLALLGFFSLGLIVWLLLKNIFSNVTIINKNKKIILNYFAIIMNILIYTIQKKKMKFFKLSFLALVAFF